MTEEARCEYWEYGMPTGGKTALQKQEEMEAAGYFAPWDHPEFKRRKKEAWEKEFNSPSLGKSFVKYWTSALNIWILTLAVPSMMLYSFINDPTVNLGKAGVWMAIGFALVSSLTIALIITGKSKSTPNSRRLAGLAVMSAEEQIAMDANAQAIADAIDKR